MSGFRVREARPSDRDAVGRMWADLMHYHSKLDPRFVVSADGVKNYIRHVHEMIRSRDARVLIAEEPESGELIGYVIAEIQVRPPMALPGVYGFVSDIYVEDNWRRHGVGRALFDELSRWFVSRRVNAMELYIAVANPSALSFWEAMGMKPFLKLMHLDL